MRLRIIALICAMLVCVGVQLQAAGGVKKSIGLAKIETVVGTLTIVGGEEKIIFVRTSDAVCYDFRIGPATKIEQNGVPIPYADLAALVGKQVTIVFRALKTGNAALSIAIE